MLCIACLELFKLSQLEAHVTTTHADLLGQNVVVGTQLHPLCLLQSHQPLTLPLLPVSTPGSSVFFTVRGSSGLRKENITLASNTSQASLLSSMIHSKPSLPRLYWRGLLLASTPAPSLAPLEDDYGVITRTPLSNLPPSHSFMERDYPDEYIAQAMVVCPQVKPVQLPSLCAPLDIAECQPLYTPTPPLSFSYPAFCTHLDKVEQAGLYVGDGVWPDEED